MPKPTLEALDSYQWLRLAVPDPTEAMHKSLQIPRPSAGVEPSFGTHRGPWLLAAGRLKWEGEMDRKTGANNGEVGKSIWQFP